MNVFSGLQIKNKIELYCYECEKISSLKVITLSKNDLKLQCDKCGEVITIPSADYLQEKNESTACAREENEEEVVYDVMANYKIGQKLHHKLFDDNGDIIGKYRDIIIVNFKQRGIKKLICNFIKDQGG